MDKDKSSSCCTHRPSPAYILRLALGGLLLFMSITKFSGGLSAFVDNMSAMFAGSILPMVFVKAFLTFIPFAEGILGVFLILGLFTRYATWAAGLLFALFIVGLTSTGNPELMGGIANNFIFMFGALFLGKMNHGTLLSLDHLICKGKCD